MSDSHFQILGTDARVAISVLSTHVESTKFVLSVFGRTMGRMSTTRRRSVAAPMVNFRWRRLGRILRKSALLIIIDFLMSGRRTMTRNSCSFPLGSFLFQRLKF